MDAVSAISSPSNSSGSRFRRLRLRQIAVDRQPRKNDNKRKITDDDINQYLVNKAIKVANKLNGEFVWRKKIERDVARGVPLDELIASKKTQQHEEIEKLRKRKEERTLEKARREEELADLARERTRAEADEFAKKEAEFVLSQSKIRSRIRLNERRAKPIDVLIALLEDPDSVESDEPCAIFKRLSFSELESLREEIKTHADSDRETPIHAEYWDALLVLCDSELDEAARRKAMAVESVIHPSTDPDVRNVLEGKSHKDLVALQSKIESAMRSGTAMVVEFWETVLRRIPVYKAKARLNEFRPRSKPEHPVEDATNGSDDQVQEEVVVDHPRKPKYLNRIYTRYEWNNYNRVHYDHDNPPPKTVQGYKFDVFYPDLLDKSKVPVYFKEEDGGNAETCVLRFHAGPPYEDIAFRVVNGEWDEKSFKSTFDGTTLRFYFNLKRFRYRR